jgi:hypothetical protein
MSSFLLYIEHTQVVDRLSAPYSNLPGSLSQHLPISMEGADYMSISFDWGDESIQQCQYFDTPNDTSWIETDNPEHTQTIESISVPTKSVPELLATFLDKFRDSFQPLGRFYTDASHQFIWRFGVNKAAFNTVPAGRANTQCAHLSSRLERILFNTTSSCN